MEKKIPDEARCIRLIEEKKEKFERFYSLLLTYNERFNLTAITEEKEVFHKHFLDSVLGEGFFPKRARCCEVGSGAGFPSIPLKLVREDLSFTLIESTGKKCEFLKTCVKELDLQGVEVLCARAEEIGKQESYRERYDVVCARAVAKLNTLAEYCFPLLKKGGLFLAYKGDAEEEVRAAENAFSVLGGAKAETVRYSLPEGYGERTLVFSEKKKPTPKNFPRGRGAERRKPL